ncbi:MAG TPA: LPS export ABC transporter periplasmic protein LptC [Rhodocyclaceae bacterium]|nr:LPS export ABC transporter periplasmic protein LptC [Rhodocyclaceae bacterium]
MKYSSSTLFPLLMLVMLAGLTLWLERASQPESVTAAAVRHDPDYMVDNFKVKRFNAGGKLFQTLDADRMWHYPDDDSTDIAMPRLVYVQDQPTWISADRAQTDAGGKTVQLDKNVVVIHETPNKPPTRITTSSLTVHPDDETAHTRAPVTITQGKTVMYGQGMDVNNKTRISVLHGRAHGTIFSAQQ